MKEVYWLQLRRYGWKAPSVVTILGFYQPPVDIHRLASMLGITVIEVSTPGWSGACRFDPDTNAATVWIRAEDHRLRKRFTLAHEIGHIVLDKPGEYLDIEFSGPAETRANDYATGLLVPRFLLDPLTPYLGSNLPRLAQVFDVSENTMRYQVSKIYGGS